MEKERKNEKWHLIRNDNGEWISDEYAVFISKLEATVLRVYAAKQANLYRYSMVQMVFCGVISMNLSRLI